MSSHKTPTRLRHHERPGTAPGTLVVPVNAAAPVISLISYSENEITESVLESPDAIHDYLKKWPVTWVNIDGLGSVDMLEEVGRIFALHPLALEDVLNLQHRAKAEDYEDHFFIVMHMMRLQDSILNQEQISLFVGDNYVLTFQERNDGDLLDPVRNRLRKGMSRHIRKAGADYLAYSILDATIDGYFPILEYFGDCINALEDSIIEKPGSPVITQTHKIKRELQTLRHAAWPLREVVGTLSGDSTVIKDETKIYLRDCHDHVINVLDILEIDRERASGLIDIYLSSINNQMNEVMKVLTIIATIFIPLSFIASVYGMNFDTSKSPFNMPELAWAYGYPFALSLMLIVAGGLLFYFYRKGWINMFTRERHDQ